METTSVKAGLFFSVTALLITGLALFSLFFFSATSFFKGGVDVFSSGSSEGIVPDEEVASLFTAGVFVFKFSDRVLIGSTDAGLVEAGGVMFAGVTHSCFVNFHGPGVQKLGFIDII